MVPNRGCEKHDGRQEDAANSQDERQTQGGRKIIVFNRKKNNEILLPEINRTPPDIDREMNYRCFSLILSLTRNCANKQRLGVQQKDCEYSSPEQIIFPISHFFRRGKRKERNN